MKISLDRLLRFARNDGEVKTRNDDKNTRNDDKNACDDGKVADYNDQKRRIHIDKKPKEFNIVIARNVMTKQSFKHSICWLDCFTSFAMTIKTFVMTNKEVCPC